MRKNIKKFAGIVLCIGMFTGCAQTPDSSLVKPKGSKAVDAYTEADDVSGSKGEASEARTMTVQSQRQPSGISSMLLKIIKAMWKMTVPSSW